MRSLPPSLALSLSLSLPKTKRNETKQNSTNENQVKRCNRTNQRLSESRNYYIIGRDLRRGTIIYYSRIE